MVARLEKHKDQSTLIKAIPEILKYDLKVRVSIIGDGSRRELLEKKKKIFLFKEEHMRFKSQMSLLLQFLDLCPLYQKNLKKVI